MIGLSLRVNRAAAKAGLAPGELRRVLQIALTADGALDVQRFLSASESIGLTTDAALIVLRELAGSPSFSLTTSGVLDAATFDPLSLFASGEEGAWYEPSTTTAFSDLEGFNFATYGQGVAHLVDKSKGATIEARRNLLAYTEQFDNAYWSKLNVSVTANSDTAPDGTLTADTVTATNVNTAIFTGISLTGGTPYNTFISVKKGVSFNFTIDDGASLATGIRVNGATGSVVTAQGGGFTLNGSSVVTHPDDNAYWLAEINFTKAVSDPTCNLAVRINDTNIATLAGVATGGASIVVWGAQLEAGSTATAYQKITDGQTISWLPGNHATQVTAGARPILARVPEGGRRNLLEKTEQFDDAYWSKIGATVDGTTGYTDPLGGNTADKITTTDALAGVFRTVSASGAHTWSVYAKADTANFLLFRTSNIPEDTYFNLATGAVATSNANHTASIESIGSGWYRCVVTSNSTNNRFNIFPTDVDGDDTPTIGSSIFVWGAQLETGSTATAYQKVVDEYDITEAGVTSLEYLSFDGTGDNFDFPQITITDSQSIFFGFEPDAEITAATTSQYVLLPVSTDSADLRGILGFGVTTSKLPNERLSWLTVAGGLVYGAGYNAANISAAPHIFSMAFGNAASSTSARIDGAGVSLVATTDGEFTATISPQRYGRIGAGTLSGKLFSLIVRGAASTAQEISDTEAYLANRSGVTL